MLSANDLVSRAYSVAVADADGVVSGECRVFKVWACSTGGGDGSVTINNAATKAGGGTTIVMSFDVSASVTPQLFDFGPNGIKFDTGLSLAITGTGCTGGVAYMVG